MRHRHRAYRSRSSRAATSTIAREEGTVKQMNPWLPSIAKLMRGLVLLACCAAPACAQPANGDVALQVRTRVAAQASLELPLWRSVSQRGVAASEVDVRRVTELASGVELWRASIAIDHWHPYLVVARAGAVCEGGGFESPDLGCVYQWLREANPRLGPDSIARLLATAADGEGAIELRWRLGSAESSDASKLAAQLPTNWPLDTTDRSGAVNRATTQVRVTVFSQHALSYEQEWRAISYAFAFGSDGKQMRWTRRVSDALRAPAP